MSGQVVLVFGPFFLQRASQNVQVFVWTVGEQQMSDWSLFISFDVRMFDCDLESRTIVNGLVTVLTSLLLVQGRLLVSVVVVIVAVLFLTHDVVFRRVRQILIILDFFLCYLYA